MEMVSPVVADEARKAHGSDPPTSRLRRVSDPVLLAVLVLPQVLWVALVLYLLDRGA